MICRSLAGAHVLKWLVVYVKTRLKQLNNRMFSHIEYHIIHIPIMTLWKHAGIQVVKACRSFFKAKCTSRCDESQTPKQKSDPPEGRQRPKERLNYKLSPHSRCRGRATYHVSPGNQDSWGTITHCCCVLTALHLSASLSVCLIHTPLHWRNWSYYWHITIKQFWQRNKMKLYMWLQMPHCLDSAVHISGNDKKE